MKSLARIVAIASLAVSSAALVACGGAGQQVEVKGGDKDLVAIAGDWEGSYTGTESGRTGPVSFSLQLGRHTAEGTVLMGGETPLKIKFVAIEGGQVSGTIDPYTDPTCSCEVVTEFIGIQDGDVITGSFTTTAVAQGIEQRGEWSVTRKN